VPNEKGTPDEKLMFPPKTASLHETVIPGKAVAPKPVRTTEGRISPVSESVG
jgi:hypothetical protein